MPANGQERAPPLGQLAGWRFCTISTSNSEAIQAPAGRVAANRGGAWSERAQTVDLERIDRGWDNFMLKLAQLRLALDQFIPEPRGILRARSRG